MRKILCFLVLALFMAVTASANGTLVGELYYTFSGSNATVTYTCDAKPTADGQNEYTGDIVIPATVNYGGTEYTVTEIGEGAFFRSTITSVEIPEGITFIGKEAFGHTSLTSVTIPNSVVTIKGDAFAYTSTLKVITIGESVDAISQGLCYQTGVTDVYSNIAGKVHTQVGYMFPDNARIHVAANRVNDYTAKWTSFNIVAEYNGVYYSFKGTEATVTYPGKESEKTNDKSVIYYGDIVIPSTITLGTTSYTVTTLGSNAFSHSAITSLEIPNTVTTIEGDAAAYIDATLATVTIGSGVTSISQGFCYGTKPTDVYLKTVSVPTGASYLFSGNPTLHVYDFIKSDFENAQYWKDYTFAGDLPTDYNALQAKAAQAQGYYQYVSTAPGYYSAASYKVIDNALANFVMLDPSSPASAINASMLELSEAIESFLASTPNPLTEGYYYFKSYYRETQFIYGDASSATTHGLRIKKIEAADPGTDKTCYFKLIKNGDNWNIQCADNGMYWASLSGGSSTTTTGKYVLLTDTPECTQTITGTGVGLFKIQTIYMGGLTRPLSNYSSDLSTQNYSETSADFKRSQWYICPAEMAFAEVDDEGKALVYGGANTTVADIAAALSGLDYNSIDLTGVGLASGTTAADIASLQSGNMLVYLPSGSTITGDNIVADGVCSNLVLTDGEAFRAPVEFTANTATYTRTMDNEWGTVCLPYDVSSDEAAKYYAISAIDGNALAVSEVATLTAGTPALVRKLSGSSVTAAATNVPVSAAINNTSGAVNMYGTYEMTMVEDANAYYIKDNKFWQCNNYFFCDAFRAYFTASGAGSNSFSIIVDNEDPTAIAGVEAGNDAAVAIYSTDGTRLGTLRSGINIVKQADGKTLKIQVK